MKNVQNEKISYSHDGVEMVGSLFHDAHRDGPLPLVMVVHEWWGCDDYARRRAAMLAELGYAGFAVDLYGGGRTASSPDEAGELMNALLADRAGLRGRFMAAMGAVADRPSVDAEKMAAIGYCMGGGIVLHMARTGTDLSAVASFHGALPLAIAQEGEAAEVTARMAVYHGEADEFVSGDDVSAFLAEVERARADCLFVLMPGATHGFTNPEATARGERFGLPLRYSELADRSSWDHMRLVLEAAFR